MFELSGPFDHLLEENSRTEVVRFYLSNDLIHRLPDADLCRLVIHNVNAVERGGDSSGVTNVSVDKFGVRVYMPGFAAAVDLLHKRIKYSDAVAACDQTIH
jgi:hypothetical protein